MLGATSKQNNLGRKKKWRERRKDKKFPVMVLGLWSKRKLKSCKLKGDFPEHLKTPEGQGAGDLPTGAFLHKLKDGLHAATNGGHGAVHSCEVRGAA